VGAPRTTAYNYNAFNQVLDVTDPDGTTLFTWDDNGNQTTRASPTDSTEYTWDARDRLSVIALPDGTTAAYGYDTVNLRVSIDDAHGARRVVLDGLEEWGEIGEATGELAARFDHDPTRIDALLAQITEAGHVATLTDALGSIYRLVDGAGHTQAKYAYDAYGARTTELASIDTRWGFTGRTGETPTNGLYARTRYLSVDTGEFLSPDRLPGGNPFWYAHDNPTRFTDPLGLRILDSIRARLVALAAHLSWLISVGASANFIRDVHAELRLTFWASVGLTAGLLGSLREATYRAPEEDDRCPPDGMCRLDPNTPPTRTRVTDPRFSSEDIPVMPIPQGVAIQEEPLQLRQVNPGELASPDDPDLPVPVVEKLVCKYFCNVDGRTIVKWYPFYGMPCLPLMRYVP
jgi:RHS repeat-associated protein